MMFKKTRQLERENKRLRDELHSLWFRVSRLMTYLGVEEVSYPPETYVQAKGSERVVRVRANTKPKSKLAKTAPRKSQKGDV